MNLKEQAYQLHKTGLSFKEIGDKLGVSKTTAYEYVKEMKLIQKKTDVKPVPNGSELGSIVRSEPIITAKPVEEKEIKNPPVIPPNVKEFTGDELLEKKFVSLAFEGKFLELIGTPSKLFSGIIWGLPKGGKSNFSLRFADYLQEYFGKVVYVAAEEGESVTLQDKFKEIGGSKITVIETRNRDVIRGYLKEKDYNFVFIDSINNAGIDSEFLEILKTENPNKSFISIVQATKGGNFKGDQALTHNCDFIIKVVEGVAYHTGRFANPSEVKIFEEPLYQKNKVKPETKVDTKIDPNINLDKSESADLDSFSTRFQKNKEEEQKEKKYFKPLNLSLYFKKTEKTDGKEQAQKKIISIKKPEIVFPQSPSELLWVVGGLILVNLIFGKDKSER